MYKESFRFIDNSGDRKYFTIVPNYILNHSTVVDQAVYLQIKRYAGEDGLCYASKRTICTKLGIGRGTLIKSIKYLVDHGWITPAGLKKVGTAGGNQVVYSYKVNDIWKMNSTYYSDKTKGASNQTPLAEGASIKNKGASNQTQGASIWNTKKNHKKNIKKNVEILNSFRESLKTKGIVR